MTDISAQIHSLELRAASRDSEALLLDDRTKGQEKHMLNLESRELRRQAGRLRQQRTELMSAHRGAAKDGWAFGWNPTTK